MIVIYDKGSGNFTKVALAAAKVVFGPTHVVQGGANPDTLPKEFFMDGNNYVVAHLSESQWAMLSRNWPNQVRALIRVSSHGAGGMPSYGPPKKVSEGAWILHATHESGEITDADWKDIFAAISEWKTSSQGSLPQRLVDALYKNHEAILAFRLLCEAKRECGKGFIKAKAFGTGLTIHAPDTQKRWLSPFGGIETERAAELIGTGRYTNQVKAVLDAAEKDWSELSKEIESFEAAYKQQEKGNS